MEILKEKEMEGFHYIKINEIPSTNSYLKNEYKKYKDNVILHTLSQTEGRGRFDRKWVSKNDLMFSILLFKNNNYSIIIPLSIIFALKKYNINTMIKWHNDIYLDNKKLAGILIEAIYQNTFIASIIGIGINYNDYSEFDAIGLNKNIDMEELISNIIIEYRKLINLNEIDLMNLYKEYSLVLNKRITYKEKKYTVVDIDNNGYLIIKDEFNNILKLTSNEIKIDKNEVL